MDSGYYFVLVDEAMYEAMSSSQNQTPSFSLRSADSSSAPAFRLLVCFVGDAL